MVTFADGIPPSLYSPLLPYSIPTCFFLLSTVARVSSTTGRGLNFTSRFRAPVKKNYVQKTGMFFKAPKPD